MAFNATAPLQALRTLVAGLSSVHEAYVGVPESLGKRVAAYVTLGGMDPRDKAGGLRSRMQSYRITFAYRVVGAEDTAEATLADCLDQLEVALYADRTLGGTVESLEADFSGADDPRYVAVAGQEFREYPVTVRVRQTRNYP